MAAIYTYIYLRGLSWVISSQTDMASTSGLGQSLLAVWLCCHEHGPAQSICSTWLHSKSFTMFGEVQNCSLDQEYRAYHSDVQTCKWVTIYKWDCCNWVQRMFPFWCMRNTGRFDSAWSVWLNRVVLTTGRNYHMSWGSSTQSDQVTTEIVILKCKRSDWCCRLFKTDRSCFLTWNSTVANSVQLLELGDCCLWHVRELELLKAADWKSAAHTKAPLSTILHLV